MGLDSISPRRLRSLARQQVADLLLREMDRSRKRVNQLERTYPSAKRDELAQRLIDHKKALAGTAGAVGGLFGFFSVPLDLVFVLYLQIALLVDVATLHRVSLRSAQAQSRLLDLLAYINGVDPVVRAGPRVLGQLALALLTKKGLPSVGRAFPVVASPVSAWLNARALTKAGREAARFYSREGKAAARE